MPVVKVKNQMNTPARAPLLVPGDLPAGTPLSYCAISQNLRSGQNADITHIAFGLAMFNPDDEPRIARLSVVVQRDLFLPRNDTDIESIDLNGDSNQIWRMDFRAPFTRLYEVPLKLWGGSTWSAYVYAIMSSAPVGNASMFIELIGEQKVEAPVTDVQL